MRKMFVLIMLLTISSAIVVASEMVHKKTDYTVLARGQPVIKFVSETIATASVVHIVGTIISGINNEKIVPVISEGTRKIRDVDWRGMEMLYNYNVTGQKYDNLFRHRLARDSVRCSQI